MLDFNIISSIKQEYYNSLDDGFYRLVKEFYLLKNATSQFGNIDASKFRETLKRKKGKLNMLEAGEVYFSVFENEIIYKAFEQSLPTGLQKAIKILLWKDYISPEALEKEIGEPVLLLKPTNPYHNYQEVLSPYKFFKFNAGPRVNTSKLYLPYVLKKILVNFYPKEPHYYFVPITDLPTDLHIFNAEAFIEVELPRLLGQRLKDNIKYTAKGRPSDSTVSKLLKNCNTKEFYVSENATLKQVRTRILAGVLFALEQKDVKVDTIVIIKKLFSALGTKIYTPHLLLNLFDGWNAVDLLDNDFLAVHKNIESVLKELKVNEWVSIANLHDLLAYRLINDKPVSIYYAVERLTIKKYLNDEESDYVIDITSDNYDQYLKYPYVKGTIFLFAAFGMMEIAYTDVDVSFDSEGLTNYTSEYDGLQYFRLTPLGAYILGITDQYQSQSTASTATKFTLAKDSLYILFEGDADLVDGMLKPYSEKVSSNRYRVNTINFLKDTREKKEVENKIALFKKIITTTLPPYWNQFFGEMLDNCTAIKANNKVKVFQLPSQNKFLQKLVVTDIITKQLIQKAEGFNILVAQDNVDKFKNRMRELGYLV